MYRRMTVNDEFEGIVKEGVLVVHTGIPPRICVKRLRRITKSHNFSGSFLNLVRDV
jgi:hypothetical protein